MAVMGAIYLWHEADAVKISREKENGDCGNGFHPLNRI